MTSETTKYPHSYMNDELVSIVIPVYNGARYLRRCLDSVLNQTYSSFQLVLVDNNSQDNSLIICEEYAKTDKRITVLQELKPGPGCARNRALTEAHGRFVTFLDCDDFWDRHYLETMISAAKNHPTVDMIVCGRYFATISDNGIIDVDHVLHYSDRLISIEEIRANPNSFFRYSGTKGPVCKLFRADIIKCHCVQFPESIMMMEDMCFNVAYLSYTREILLINDVLYYQILHQNSLSKSIALDNVGIWNDVLKEINCSTKSTNNLKWDSFITETAQRLPFQFINYNIRKANNILDATRIVSKFLNNPDVNRFINEKCQDTKIAKIGNSYIYMVFYCMTQRAKTIINKLSSKKR